MVWAVLTVAVTLLLRPNTGRNRSLFFGSGPAAEMFNKIFGLSSVPEAVQKAPGITMVARGPARKPVTSHPVKKLELAAAPEAGTAAVAAVAPAPPPVTKAPAKAPEAAPKVPEATPDGAALAQAPPRKPAGAKPQAAAVRHPHGPASAPAVAVKLGPKYLDDVHGYSIHFPVGWSPRSRDGGRWVVDATDDAGDLISLGFRTSKLPLKVDAYNREAITRGLKTRPEIFVLGDGVGTLGGRPCLWHKYTGPVARRQSAGRRMTVIHFRLPLENGKLMELRVATAPEKFQQLAPSLKQSIDTLRFVTPQARAR
jgi:hypothetical protein